MRRLSDSFLACLKSGFLAEIVRSVSFDSDLNLEIRRNYINIYYKGNSLLKLSEEAPEQYRVDIDGKFVNGIDMPAKLVDSKTTSGFLNNVPLIKQNILRYGKRSLEIEYEQMIIRANNFEPRNNSDYFVIDRQYAANRERFDLVGFFWRRKGRHQQQEVPLCIMEVKFALNDDIADVHNQVQRYYDIVAAQAEKFAGEQEICFQQKLDLGLYRQSENRLRALRTLTFSRDISQFQFVLIFVDYNPNSSKLDMGKLAKLPFAGQIRVFRSGFAMWDKEVKLLSDFKWRQ